MKQLCDEFLTPEKRVQFFKMENIKAKLIYMMNNPTIIPNMSRAEMAHAIINKSTYDPFWFVEIGKYAINQNILLPQEVQPYAETAFNRDMNEYYSVWFMQIADFCLEKQIFTRHELINKVTNALHMNKQNALIFIDITRFAVDRNIQPQDLAQLIAEAQQHAQRSNQPYFVEKLLDFFHHLNQD